jgi:hypothetical protein
MSWHLFWKKMAEESDDDHWDDFLEKMDKDKEFVTWR